MQGFIGRFSLPDPAGTFAGFTFPKWAWVPIGRERYRDLRAGKVHAGPYYGGAPGVARSGASFYLDSDFMPGLRWQWCDEIAHRIGHKGWYTDPYDYLDTVRGLVFRLPKGRGFLAGWSMGHGMASFVDYEIYDDEIAAAYAADSMAEEAAESEREYREEQYAEEEEEEEEEEY